MVRSERTTRRFYECCGKVHAPVSMLFPPIDPNERFRARRAAVRRRKRLRRSAAVASVLVAVLLLGMGAQFVGTEAGGEPAADLATLAATPASGPRTLPIELRGVHVTMGLASLPGKLDEYLDLERDGLTALELDVKDENGEIGFMTRSVPLAVSIGAARDYFDARAVARQVHQRGVYLIGRVVVFEDPVLSHARTDLAIRRSGGGVWRDAAGLGWTNPYDRRVWKYNVDVAIAATKDTGIPALRREPSRAVRRARLGRSVRPLCRPRPRDRSAAETDGAVPRHRVCHDVPVVVRHGRARPP